MRSIDIADKSFQITKQAFEDERKGFEKSNSSYILIDSVAYKILKPLVRDNVIHLRIRNVGKIPARLQTYMASASLGQVPKKYDYSATDVKPITVYMPAGGILTIPITLPPMSKFDFDRFSSEKDFLVLYGEIHYIDMLTNTHKSLLFSFRVYPDKEDMISMTEEHNEVIDVKN